MSYTCTALSTSPGASSYQWTRIACDQTGQYVAAGTADGYIYTTQDSGSTWSQSSTTFTNEILEIVMSNSDSTYPTTLAILDSDSNAWISSDFGSSWTNTSTTLTTFAATNRADTPLIGVYKNVIYFLYSTNTWSANKTISNSSYQYTYTYTTTTALGGTKVQTVDGPEYNTTYVFTGIVCATNTITVNGTTTTTTTYIATGSYNADGVEDLYTTPSAYTGAYDANGLNLAWTGQTNPPLNMYPIASDSTGDYLVGAIVTDSSGNEIMYYTQSGASTTWTSLTNPSDVTSFGDIVSDSTGQYLAVIGKSSLTANIYTSTSSSAPSFALTSELSSDDYTGLACDSSGLILWTCIYLGAIYNSTDGGSTWSYFLPSS